MKFAKPHLFSIILTILAVLLILFIILFFNGWINHLETGMIDMSYKTSAI